MKILKIRDVKTPTRGTEGSAGIDFYVPNDYEKVMVMRPGDSVNIPSGIKVKIPKGYALIAFNKSGQATKKDLQVGACVIDEDYQGEVHLHVRNTGNNTQQLSNGEKIVQMLLVPVSNESIEEVETIEDLYKEVSQRGSGAFGSTGSF